MADYPREFEELIYGMTEEELQEYIRTYDYELIVFKDRIVEYPNRYLDKLVGTDLDGNKITDKIRHEGKVLDVGTPLTSLVLGRMDLGLVALTERNKKLVEDNRSMKLEIDNLKNFVFADFASSTIYNFADGKFTDIEKIDGFYDRENGEVSI